MDRTYTNQQRKALHLLFKHIAEEGVDRGISLRMVMRKLPNADMPLTKDNVKEIWRDFQMALLHKESTTQLTTKDIDEVLEVMAKFFAEEFDWVLDFPSVESIMSKLRMESGE